MNITLKNTDILNYKYKKKRNTDIINQYFFFIT